MRGSLSKLRVDDAVNMHKKMLLVKQKILFITRLTQCGSTSSPRTDDDVGVSPTVRPEPAEGQPFLRKSCIIIDLLHTSFLPRHSVRPELVEGRMNTSCARPSTGSGRTEWTVARGLMSIKLLAYAMTRCAKALTLCPFPKKRQRARTVSEFFFSQANFV